MAVDQRLEWTQKNRLKRVRAQYVGVPVSRFVECLDTSNQAATREVASAIANVVDDEFRAHCRVVLRDKGQLVVNVDHPALAYSLRARWLLPIREVLSSRHRRWLVRQVVFLFGTTGAALPAPVEN